MNINELKRDIILLLIKKPNEFERIYNIIMGFKDNTSNNIAQIMSAIRSGNDRKLSKQLQNLSNKLTGKGQNK